MDLSKIFDCGPFDSLFAKLAAYGVSNTDLKFVFLHLTDR